MKKIKKSTWLPLVMLLYLIGMTLYFAPSLIAGGEIIRLIVVFIIEIIVILLLHLFLKRRENLPH